MNSISILGIYAADLVFFGDKIPKIGETVLGKEHIVGPGGKGSNQAVGASKAGAKVHFISIEYAIFVISPFLSVPPGSI